MAQMKTPGVYLIEKNAFPNSVVEVATAVPAFIGYTEKAVNGTQSLLNKPFRITSFAEYMQYFGGAPDKLFELTLGTEKVPISPAVAARDAVAAVAAVAAVKNESGEETSPAIEAVEAQPAVAAKEAVVKEVPATGNLVLNKSHFNLQRNGDIFRLFDAIRFFYQNGGGPCYIVSVGDYSNGISAGLLDGSDTTFPGGGLMTLEKEQEPTMVLVPDALSLSFSSCYTVYQSVVAHCVKMMSRIAILDVYNGDKGRKDPDSKDPDSDDPDSNVDVIEKFRTGVGINGLKYATAYYPWVETTIVQEAEVSFSNLTDSSLTILKNLILNELGIPANAPAAGTIPAEDSKKAKTRDFLNDMLSYNSAYVKQKIENPDMDKKLLPEDINKSLVFLSPSYNNLLKEIQNRLNVLPPASAMAGIYTMVDSTRGVWKAPANVSLNAVVRPTVNITHEDQEDLNVSLTGKSINAIRSFIGEGVLVWGARTLDGNSQDWKYINVRRTLIMLEQSVKAASKAYVFEPNDAGTWLTVKSMIENFLYSQWKSGALAGSKPDEAYSVHVGLGDTMTGDDILNGIMRITVLIAVSHPAEFIEITFQQQMQKS